MFKNPKGSPFHIFWHWGIFPNGFCIEFRFPQHATSEFCFLRPTFFQFIFYQNPLSIFTRNETVCEHRGILKAFGSMRLNRDFIKKYPKKMFLNFSFFFKDSVVSSWDTSGFRALCQVLRYILAL